MTIVLHALNDAIVSRAPNEGLRSSDDSMSVL